jgi:hypothetical protein
VAKGFLFDNVVVGLAAQHLGRGAAARAAPAPRCRRASRSGCRGATTRSTRGSTSGGGVGVGAARRRRGGRRRRRARARAAAGTRSRCARRRRTLEPGRAAGTAGLGLTRDRVSLDYAFEPFAGGRRTGWGCACAENGLETG